MGWFWAGWAWDKMVRHDWVERVERIQVVALRWEIVSGRIQETFMHCIGMTFQQLAA